MDANHDDDDSSENIEDSNDIPLTDEIDKKELSSIKRGVDLEGAEYLPQ
jgi:hypothetical protein